MRPLIALSLFLALALRAEGATAPTADPVLGGATAVLRINDLQWLEREVTSFAATSGGDPAPLRGVLAQLLFRSRSLAGIDPGRPALLAWRPGPAPLVAVIPLTDRRAFVADFGATTGVASPLVRVGEAQGTVVYKQSTAAGLVEYRLLVQDDTAYLARTVEECRLLAQRPPRVVTGEPPVTFRGTGEVLRQAPSAELDLLGARAGLGGAVVRYASRGWNDIIAQVAGLSLDIVPAADGAVRANVRITARPDTVLAQWISAQKNTGSRLLPLVRGKDTIVALYGRLDWQGQLDRLGQRLTDVARSDAGERWSPRAEEAWRSLWEIVDRGGAFAFTVDSVRAGDPLGLVVRQVVEQPRAQELAALERMLEGVWAADGVVLADAAAGGWTGFTATSATGPQRLVVADDRHHLTVVAGGAETGPAAEALVAALGRPVPPPEGVPAVVALLVNCTGLLRSTLPPASGDRPEGVLPQVDLAVALKATAQGALVVEAELPLQRLAVLLREVAALRATDR